VLTRRREAYHELATAPPQDAGGSREHGSRAPSIHDIEKGIRLERLPPADTDERAMLVDRVLPGLLSLEAYSQGEYVAVASWARVPLAAQVQQTGSAVEIVCRPDSSSEHAQGLIEKRLRFAANGEIAVMYRWNPSAFAPGAVFAPEISLAHPLDLRYTPAAEVWSFPIATVSKSERGMDETVQGQSLTPRWSVALGEARVEVTPG
jgi:Alpha-amylase/4-alpha-glucanotransferase, C-terminal